MRFFFAAPTAADADRIAASGFNMKDSIMAKMPYGVPKFVNQPGVLASSELDPRTGFAVEIDFEPNVRYLIRHELISPVADVRYYILLLDIIAGARRRRVPDSEVNAARASGLAKWQDPLVWFGKDQDPVRGHNFVPECPLPGL